MVVVLVRIIEDNEDVAFFFRTFLEHQDIDVRVTSDSFITLLDEALWTGVDAAIIDLMLGGSGPQGIDILRWLLQHVPQVRRVVVSAVLDVHPEAMELADVVIGKPPDPASILFALQRPHV